MSYTKVAMIVALVYALVFDAVALVLLYHIGLTTKYTVPQQFILGVILALLNFMLINLMFYIADVSKHNQAKE